MTPDSTQANGLLCWLRCDDASGDLVDSTYQRNDALANGNIAYQQAGKSTLGAGYGVAPTSAAAIATVPVSTDYNWNSLLCGTVSVQVWFKANSAFSAMWGTKHALIYKSSANGDTYGWYLGVLPGGGNTVVFRVMDAATSPYTASYVETDFTQFHHYVGTFDGTNVRLYRDGVQVAVTFVSGTIGHSKSYITTIGEGIDGVLDDIAVWNRVLTATEVAQLYGQATYWVPVTTRNIADTFFDIYLGQTNNTPLESLYPASIVFGPYAVSVRVVSGDAAGLLPMTAPDDQWVVNGANWTTPAWINTSTPHVIAAGTTLATLAPGQTLTIQLRSKSDWQAFRANGRVTVFRSGVAGEGMNIALVNPQSVVATLSGVATDSAFAPATMQDGLLEPANLVPDLIPAGAVAGDFSTAMSMSTDTVRPVGTVQDFALHENVDVDPSPAAITATVDSSHVVTLLGIAGPTNLVHLDLYWEVDAGGVTMVIPVSPTWIPTDLPLRQITTTTFAIPRGTLLKGHRARFVVEANGPGASDSAVRFFSSWIPLDADNFDYSTDVAPTLPPSLRAYPDLPGGIQRHGPGVYVPAAVTT